jgi:hypothetical protein
MKKAAEAAYLQRPPLPVRHDLLPLTLAIPARLKR